MADAPLILRGRYYNTRRAFRCPNHHQCVMCLQCQNYNRNNAMCNFCEAGKNPALLCRHTDAQRRGFISIQMMFKRPMSHVDDRPVSAQDSEKGLHNEAALIEAEANLDTLGLNAGHF